MIWWTVGELGTVGIAGPGQMVVLEITSQKHLMVAIGPNVVIQFYGSVQESERLID